MNRDEISALITLLSPHRKKKLASSLCYVTNLHESIKVEPSLRFACFYYFVLCARGSLPRPARNTRRVVGAAKTEQDKLATLRVTPFLLQTMTLACVALQL